MRSGVSGKLRERIRIVGGGMGAAKQGAYYVLLAELVAATP